MKIAVSGATGFLGRHLIRALAQREGVEIVALVRTPAPVGTFPDGVAQRVCAMETADAQTYAAIGAPDRLAHLAWGGLPQYHALHHFERESPASYHFIKTLVASGLSHVLVTGTCYEYGMKNGEMHEDMPSAPANPYAFAKDQLRQSLDYLRSQTPFHLTWARLFYMYGEGQAPTSLYAQLCAAGRTGAARFAMSQGDQLRDYLTVEHVAQKLATLLTQVSDVGIINVCSGVPISVRGLVEHIIADHQWSLSLDLGAFPYSRFEPMAFWGSTSKWDSLMTTPTPTPPQGRP